MQSNGLSPSESKAELWECAHDHGLSFPFAAVLHKDVCERGLCLKSLSIPFCIMSVALNTAGCSPWPRDPRSISGSSPTPAAQSMAWVCSVAAFSLVCTSLEICSNLLTTTCSLVVGTCGLGAISIVGWSLAALIFCLGMCAVRSLPKWQALDIETGKV